VATQPLPAALDAGAAAYCASPLTVATQACFTTHSGDASLDAENSSKSYIKISYIIKSKKIIISEDNAHSSKKIISNNIIYHISKKIISKMIKLTISNAHNIIYHISKYQKTMLIVQRRSHPIISYIIYQRRSYIISKKIISKMIKLTISNAHNIIYHISKYQKTMLIVQRRSHPIISYIIYQRRSYIISKKIISKMIKLTISYIIYQRRSYMKFEHMIISKHQAHSSNIT
jgi:hypothetical protein